MPRIRYIKPDFFLDEHITEVDPLAQLLFIGLWCYSDREGRLEDTPRRIKAEILPYRDADTEALLASLHPRFILRYEAKGKKYIQINNFLKHQRPHINEPKSIIPAPDKSKHLPITHQAPTKHSLNGDGDGDGDGGRSASHCRPKKIPPKGFLPNGQVDGVRARVALGDSCYDPADLSEWDRMDYQVRRPMYADWQENVSINKQKKRDADEVKLRKEGMLPPL